MLELRLLAYIYVVAVAAFIPGLSGDQPHLLRARAALLDGVSSRVCSAILARREKGSLTSVILAHAKLVDLQVVDDFRSLFLWHGYQFVHLDYRRVVAAGYSKSSQNDKGSRRPSIGNFHERLHFC